MASIGQDEWLLNVVHAQDQHHHHQQQQHSRNNSSSALGVEAAVAGPAAGAAGPPAYPPELTILLPAIHTGSSSSSSSQLPSRTPSRAASGANTPTRNGVTTTTNANSNSLVRGRKSITVNLRSSTPTNAAEDPALRVPLLQYLSSSSCSFWPRNHIPSLTDAHMLQLVKTTTKSLQGVWQIVRQLENQKQKFNSFQELQFACLKASRVAN